MSRHVSDQTPADAGVSTGWLATFDADGVPQVISGPVTLVRDGEGGWFLQGEDGTTAHPASPAFDPFRPQLDHPEDT